jgi:hypothetical protein
MVDESGVPTTLTLPTGITLKTDQVPRFAVFGRYVVMVNTPNRPITIDALGVVRVLVPFPPVAPVSLSSGGAGNLTGDYKAKQTFVIRDAYGNVISESDFGPAMLTAFTAAARTLAISDIQTSPDISSVTHTNIYRTVDAGEIYFLWKELDGNEVNDFNSDDLADLALSIFTAPTLGTPPDLTLAAEWRGRIWGVSRSNLDVVSYTEAGTMYAWSTNNQISIPRVGSDARGVTGMIARRESLVVGRRDSIKQITGTSNRDFRVVNVSDETGIESNESIAVWEDVIYFLGKGGVYKIDANGVTNLSLGHTQAWFTTDTYFNRSRFQYAFGYIDPIRLKYRLHLSAAGSSDNDRWIEYDLEDGTWWGPHKTDAFTPTSGIVVADSTDRLLPMMGSSSGFLWEEQTTATDDTATGIDFDVDTGFDPQGSADSEKYWGLLSVLGKVQSAGTVQITPRVGYLNAAAKLAWNYVMTEGRQVLGRIGVGALLKLNFRHSTAGEPVELYGYEIEDVHELDQR